MLTKNMSQFRVKSSEIKPMLTPGHTLKARKRRVVTKGGTKASSSILNTIYRKDELLTPEYDDDGMTWKEDELPWLATDTDNTIDIESEPVWFLSYQLLLIYSNTLIFSRINLYKLLRRRTLPTTIIILQTPL